jgi:dimethylamine/trimethylamine dehydrogenase
MDQIMPLAPRSFADFGTALLVAYEEEVVGEGYFGGLALQHPPGPIAEALLLLRDLEVVTAAAILPLIRRHGLTPRPRATLLAEGLQEARRTSDRPWAELLAEMAQDYDAYMDEFAALERLAPAADHHLTRCLSDHEAAIIAFAKAELAGDADPMSLLRAAIARLQAI